MDHDLQSVFQSGIERAGTLWKAGRPVEGLKILKELEEKIGSEPDARSKYEIILNRSACRLLHDLEKNWQSYGYAEKCIARYTASGDDIQKIIAMVYKGDALSGLGYADEAILTLIKAYHMADEKNLQNAMDISAICLANVLAETGNFIRAQYYYKKGISIAAELEHEKIRIYGEIHHSLFKADKDNIYKVEPFLNLADLAGSKEYYYLQALALSFAFYAAWRSQDAEEYKKNKDINIEDKFLIEFPIFIIYRFAFFILNNEYNQEDIKPFLQTLSQCEGLKWRITFISSALSVLSHNQNIAFYDLKFIERWLERFETRSLSVPINLRKLVHRIYPQSVDVFAHPTRPS